MHTSLVSPLLWRRALVRKVLYKILGFNGKTPVSGTAYQS